MEDTELLKMIDYMKILASANDVRDVISKSFSIQAFNEELVNDYIMRH